MKILYLLKRQPDETLKKIISEHQKSDGVITADIRENSDYDRIIDLITTSDRVISW